jgi:hypothetical protein
VGDHDPEGHATAVISMVIFTDPIIVESGATALIKSWYVGCVSKSRGPATDSTPENSSMINAETLAT